MTRLCTWPGGVGLSSGFRRSSLATSGPCGARTRSVGLIFGHCVSTYFWIKPISKKCLYTQLFYTRSGRSERPWNPLQSLSWGLSLSSFPFFFLPIHLLYTLNHGLLFGHCVLFPLYPFLPSSRAREHLYPMRLFLDLWKTGWSIKVLMAASSTWTSSSDLSFNRDYELFFIFYFTPEKTTREVIWGTH